MNGLAEYRSVDEMRARYAAVKARARNGAYIDPTPCQKPKLVVIPAPFDLLWTQGYVQVPWPRVELILSPDVFTNGSGWSKLVGSERVIFAVCQAFDIRRGDLIGPRRFRDFIYPRMLAAFLMRRHCPWLSLPQIGCILGGRDHSTILHACREWPKHAARFAKQIAEVEAML